MPPGIGTDTVPGSGSVGVPGVPWPTPGGGTSVVVGATGDAQLSPETTVEVTGTVQQAFVVTEVEEELGVNLDDALFAEWEQEPYVVADSVEVIENVD